MKIYAMLFIEVSGKVVSDKGVLKNICTNRCKSGGAQKSLCTKFWRQK